MIESDRPAEGQPAETPVGAQPVSIAKAREGTFTLVQRVLREARDRYCSSPDDPHFLEFRPALHR